MSLSNTPTYVLGIDLGTTYSCGAVWKDGHAIVIPNDHGNRTTPSCVAFTENERLIGQSAKDQATYNPQNTIYDSKRLIGRRFDDVVVQEDLANWPFTITTNDKRQPSFNVVYKKKKHQFFPEEISAMILNQIKTNAESNLQTTIQNAVITVPAYFNDSQRQATKDAAQIAGLNCLRILNEPTAAALAYGLDKTSKDEQRVLIVDLGGGTFDVSLLEMEKGTFEVIATSGDTHLGGQDFDNRLANLFSKEFTKRHKCAEIKTNSRAYKRLQVASEKAKIALSTSLKTTIDIDSLQPGLDFNYSLTRAQFEESCLDLFKKCLDPIRKTLDDAKIKKSQINEIVLVGGSTRIPYIQQLLKDFFDGRELNKSLHPDEAVACGAAIQGAIIAQSEDLKTKDIILLDVTPLDLGVETARGVMSIIIERNTPVPCKKTQLFTTYVDNQKAVTINVFEGMRKMTEDNNKLGTFDLVDIPPNPRNIPHIDVTFELDVDGILTVIAQDTVNSIYGQIRIVKDKGRLTPNEIAKLMEDAKRYHEDDLKTLANVEAKNRLESSVYQINSNLSDPEIEKKLNQTDRTRLSSVMMTIQKWMEAHPNAETAEYNSQQLAIDQVSQTIFTRIYSDIPVPVGKKSPT
jgi:heat shock protein 1/8